MLGGGGGDTSASVLGSRSGGGNDREAAAAASVAGGCNGSDEVDVAGGTNMFDSNGNNMNNYSGEDDKGRVDESERSFGGNRWPRQETVALLKIRSDMDVTFREASTKGPLWEEVSRKLAELGYNRSAKKCKEKFENVYKYHKRTKDGRSGKVDGKTYRFFEQLEALQNQPFIQSSLPPPPRLQPKPVMVEAATDHLSVPRVNVSSTTLPGLQQNILLAIPPNPTSHTIPSFLNFSSADLMSNSTSSSTSSDLGLEGQRKRKRKWKEFFERLIKEVIEKQEEMQKKFLEAIEKRDRERMVREEAWRMQEVSRLNREREILAQERSMAAAKDAAVMAFLQKLSEQKQQSNPENNPQKNHHQEQQQPQALPKQVSALADPPPPPVPLQTEDSGDQSYTPSSSRWPKFEIEALIKLRTELDAKYQDSGPKGPLWEEISSAMKRLGYNRNAKRCKEKWENINKYFKKVKESNKKRPEDSKTCPYFHQLDALYREKNKHDSSKHNQSSAPLMVRPEQQWPPPPHKPQHDHAMEDMESDHNQDENEVEDEDECEAGSFEIVASKPGSMSTDE